MANIACFRFYEELNDFLPFHQRKKQIEYSFSGKQSVKDAIEALGVPHAEVDLIVANGASVGFDFRVSNGDEISVYPLFEALDISPIVKLRERPLRNPSFICDVHLGALARLLRLAGFNTLYKNNYNDEEIVEIAALQNRCILTRDRGMLKRNAVVRGYCVRSTQPEEQIREVVDRFFLGNAIKPFSRCMECNGAVAAVAKETVIGLLQEKTARYYDEFYRCESCSRIYWKGSHYEKLAALVESLTKH